MIIEQFEIALHDMPSHPFAIPMADGCACLVKHPDCIVRSQSGRAATVYGDNNTFAVLDLPLMTELEADDTDLQRDAA